MVEHSWAATLDPSTPRKGAVKEQGGGHRVKALNSILDSLDLEEPGVCLPEQENKD